MLIKTKRYYEDSHTSTSAGFDMKAHSMWIFYSPKFPFARCTCMTWTSTSMSPCASRWWHRRRRQSWLTSSSTPATPSSLLVTTGKTFQIMYSRCPLSQLSLLYSKMPCEHSGMFRIQTFQYVCLECMCQGAWTEHAERGVSSSLTCYGSRLIL